MFNLFDESHGVKAGGFCFCFYKTTKGEGADFLCIHNKEKRLMFNAAELRAVDVEETTVVITTEKEQFVVYAKKNKDAVAIGELLCKLTFFLRSGEKAGVFDLDALDKIMGSSKNSNKRTEYVSEDDPDHEE